MVNLEGFSQVREVNNLQKHQIELIEGRNWDRRKWSAYGGRQRTRFTVIHKEVQ